MFSVLLNTIYGWHLSMFGVAERSSTRVSMTNHSSLCCWFRLSKRTHQCVVGYSLLCTYKNSCRNLTITGYAQTTVPNINEYNLQNN